jgi:lysophospholipase L1-like esterase
MKRRTTLLLAAALAVALALALAGAAWGERRPRAYAPRGPGDIYLALGDSLAWGAGLEDRAAQSYPALLRGAMAADRPIELANLGLPGETSGSFVARQLPRALELIAAARGEGRRVSPITLDIGGNDLRNVERAPAGSEADAQRLREAAVAAARENIAYALDALRDAAGPDADLAIMTYYNPYGGDASLESGDAYWVERLNGAIREEAARRGVAVADVYPAFTGGRFYTHTFVLSGDIHANAQGHSLIAEVFREALGY